VNSASRDDGVAARVVRAMCVVSERALALSRTAHHVSEALSNMLLLPLMAQHRLILPEARTHLSIHGRISDPAQIRV
jgi:hypothetical protein